MTTRRRVTVALGTDHLPRLPRVYVPRLRLWARLDRATEGAVTVLVGPGGAGKTLGVSGWLRRTGRAEETSWVRADPTWTPARLLALLDSAAEGADRPPLVVVDDAHQLPLTTVRAIDQRLDADPYSFRVLLVSRWDIPLTRLAPELLGHLTMLRGELLRLDEEESAALVSAHVNASSAEIAEAISGRARGWCAAVVLTARAVAVAPDPLETARRYAEGGTSVADRVASEVFAALQPRQRHLLLCVANEPVVTPGLAVHLSHDAHAGEVLAELESTGLLITRLSALEDPRPRAAVDDDDVARYAIHPLLAEVVRRRIAAGGVDVVRAGATVRRAVRLDLAGGAIDGAFRRLVGIGDHSAAARLLADEGTRLVLRGHGGGVHAFVHQHPSAVEVDPESWFAIALERWYVDDVAAARPWLDRILTDPLPTTAGTRLQVACVRLLRSRLGLEPMAAAVRHAREVLATDDGLTDNAVAPVLLCELAITEGWLGELAVAEADLTSAVRLSRSQDLPVLTAGALSHLALTEFVQGREAACLEIADDVLAMTAGQPCSTRYSVGRARLARELSLMTDVPSVTGVTTSEVADPIPLHAADPTTRFWARLLRCRLELAQGSVSAAERALDVPIETPQMPRHLEITLLLERAFLASLAADQQALTPVQRQLAELGATGEEALVAGLRADITGDRRTAITRFAEAAELAEVQQPPVRALALTTAAQLLDGLGDHDAALELVDQAVIATEVRRNAVPFLGWSRHGSQVSDLTERLARRRPTSWVLEVAAGIAGVSGIATYFGPTTAHPRERVAVPEGQIRPTLSPRERDVLYELARGSTYADIATHLFVSENTVKTHVSSLYAKLSVNRRSAALAAARTLNLL